MRHASKVSPPVRREATKMASNTSDDPDYWRKRAEKARAIAVQMTHAHTRAIMLGIAQDYEILAERAEQCTKTH